MVFTEVESGSFAAATDVPVLATYRPRDTLSAVLPLPKRSYAAPRRGVRSFHDGTPETAAKSRAGTHPEGVAAVGCVGAYPLKHIHHAPLFGVRIVVDHSSWGQI